MHPFTHMVVSFLLVVCSFYPHPHLILDMHPFTLVVCSFCPHLHLICTHSYTRCYPFCSCLSFVLYALTHTWYAPTHTHGGLLFVLACRLFFLSSLTLDMHPFTLVVCSYSPHLHLICTHSYTRCYPFCSCLSFVLFALTNTWYARIHACRLFLLPSLTLDMHPFIHTAVSFSFFLSFVLFVLTYTWYAPTHTLGGLLLLVVPYQVPVETNVQDRKSSQRGILD